MVPCVEQQASTRLEHAPGLAVGGGAVGEEHDAELTANQIKGGIFERQRLRIRLAPSNAVIPVLPCGGIIEHRLIEVGRDVTDIGGKLRRQCARHHAAAGCRFQHGFGRKCGSPSSNIPGVALEDQGNQIAVVVFRNRAREDLVAC